MKHLFGIVLLLITQTLFAQDITILGKVIDDDTEEGIPFANVFFKGSTSGTATDIDGFYKMTLVPASDTLQASALGYKISTKVSAFKKDTVRISFRLLSSDLTLSEIVVYAGENPANEIVRNIIKNKPKNRLSHFNNYQYEQYEKIELDFHNIDEKIQKNRFMRPFDFIFDNVDSLSDEKPFLPAFIVETLADVYFAQPNDKEKRILKAQKRSGINNPTVVQFIDRMHQEYDVYNNWIPILEKSFASPFSKMGLFYYEYYIEDSTHIDGQWCRKLRFKPKRKQENTFYGDFWVADSSHAITRVNMRMSKEVNLNFVERLIIYGDYTYDNGFWLPKKQKTMIDFAPTQETPGLIQRKSISYKKFQLNIPKNTTLYETLKPEDYELDSLNKSAEFWEEARHNKLSKNETVIYTMIDSIKNMPIFKTYSTVLRTLATGDVMVYEGNDKFGPVRMGSVYSIYSFNPIERHRFQLGTQMDFNKQKIRLDGYLAYGTRDKQWKYKAQFRYRLSTYPRIMLGAAVLDDVFSSTENSEVLGGQNIFTGVFRRNIPQRMVYAQEAKIFLQRNWKNWWQNRITLLHRNLDPIGTSTENSFKFGYIPDLSDVSQVDTAMRTTELIYKIRYSYKEKLLDGNFNQVSIGSSNRPVFEFQYNLGVKGILGSQYDYHKLTLGVQQWFYTNPIGWFHYKVKVGKVFGTLPSLLLEVHPGNETFFHDRSAFNTMNKYEFISDQYVQVMLEHHFDGYLLNKIPLLRKLDFRTVVAFKGVWGSVSNANREANQLNKSDVGGTIAFRSPTDEPFMEVGIGIENILKFIRVDAVWRLNYLDNPEAYQFMFQGGLYFNF